MAEKTVGKTVKKAPKTAAKKISPPKVTSDGQPRCFWATGIPDFYEKYHDEEWGVPCFDEHKMFEMMILEGAQAGLSWQTVLAKRDSYRQAFDDFNVEKIARYDEVKIFWQFVDGKPKQNAPKSRDDVKATTSESDALSKALLKAGFKFVGSTIVYAHMQACGMVNDHFTTCFRYEAVREMGRKM